MDLILIIICVLHANFCWLGDLEGKNDMSLEGKCCWERDSALCLRRFVVYNTCYVLLIRNLFPHRPLH